MTHNITIIISFVIFIVYLINLFLLVEIKSRIRGNLSKAFNYLIIAISIILLLRIEGILINFEIFMPVYLRNALATLLSLSFLMFLIKVYKSLRRITDK